MGAEKSLQNKVITYLKSLEGTGNPVFYEKRQAGGFNYRIGIPDLYFVINGKHYEIELKRPDKKVKLRPEQLFWIERLNSVGIKSIISGDWNEIKNFIDTALVENGIKW